MDSNEIDTYLHALDEELAKRLIRKPVRIVVVGGVYMLFFLRNRAPRRMSILCLWTFLIPQTQPRRQKYFAQPSTPSLKPTDSGATG